MESDSINFKLPLGKRRVQRTGLAYFKSKFSRDDFIDSLEDLSKLSDDECTIDVDIKFLKTLDPKEWKDQDHYAVLGLEKLRFDAADDDIKRAYRHMVLLHHPDKRKAKGEEVRQDDDYFTCITKAYEILGNPKLRRSYDSIDPTFDDSLPSQSDIENNFYESFNQYFAANARWSEKRNVPTFGDDNSKREDVERFYSFWYDFKSWREFSYLDEEDKEKGQDRDERRWIEKENKAARIKRKKEEMARIRALVDLAYNNDKRIQKFKNEDKERKLAAKRAKMDAAQAQKAEQERAIREAQLAKERAEKAEQKRIEQIRLEKEQLKKVQRKEKKLLRDKAKELKYWSNGDKDLLKHMEGVEKICEIFTLAELQDLNKRLAEGKANKEVFLTALRSAEKKIRDQLEEFNQTQQRRPLSKGDVKEVRKGDIWNNENVQLLIKAVNLFPAGTTQRWDVIASFINQHTTTEQNNINARDVLNKAKALQHSDFSKNSLKAHANEEAFASFEKNKKDVQTCNDITLNNHSDGDKSTPKLPNGVAKEQKELSNKNTAKMMNGFGNGPSDPTTNTDNKTASAAAKASTASSSKTWTKEEQALLEQAIKTFSAQTPDRWDRIAECIPNRTKKDCLRRVKELVELVNSKKEAQQAVK